MSFSFGSNIKITVFGQSHAEGIGIVIDGIPVGFAPDMMKVRAFMARRAPGGSSLTSPRKEADEVEIISGLFGGKTCGAPLCALIRNHNARSSDYNIDIPRPSHADFAAFVKYAGANDYRGGGAFSGRMTAPLCFAGAICKQLLERQDIYIGAHIASVGEFKDITFNPVSLDKKDLLAPAAKPFSVLSDAKGQKMQDAILRASAEGDSIGGVIECGVIGFPAGIGNPIFDGVENCLAYALFGIPAVKGLEFGSGFFGSTLKGSQNNDAFYMQDGAIKTKTNNHGGILGGISSGMPIIFRLGFKPTPSIAKEQDSVSFSAKNNIKLAIKGRHDPCITVRAVPCVEGITALVLLDMFMDRQKEKTQWI